MVAGAAHVGEQLDPRAVGGNQEHIQVLVAGVSHIDGHIDIGRDVRVGHTDRRGERAFVGDSLRRVDRCEDRQQSSIFQRFAAELPVRRRACFAARALRSGPVRFRRDVSGSGERCVWDMLLAFRKGLLVKGWGGL